MLNELIQKLKSLVTKQDSIDPTQFNDPVALKTEWTPARKGGANFQTRELIKAAPHRVEFRPTKTALFLYTLFALSGIGFLGIIYFVLGFRYKIWTHDIDYHLFPLIFIALVFSTIGCFLLYFGTAPIIFDKMKSAFWKGRKSSEHVLDPKTLKDFIRFNDIYALQLISEYIRSKNYSYYSYELNIVREDGSRVNIIDHGKKDKLKQDAQTLATFLDKPLWDAVS